MNNPMQFIQAMRNPQAFVQNMMNNSQVMQNPILNNAFKMYQNGDTEGLNRLVENMCHEKGTTMENVKKQLMQQFGM